MISYTETLYRQATEYQRLRAAANEEYESKAQALEPFRGSAGYDKRTAELLKQHEEQLQALHDEYRQTFGKILAGMKENVSKRKLTPPSAEQLALLQGLQMLENPTREQLDRAAESCRGCALALDVLAGIARKQGISHSYWKLAGEMSSDKVADSIAGLREQLRDFLTTDQSRPGRLAAKYLQEMHGAEVEVPKRPDFRSKEEFYSMFAGLDPDSVPMFEEAVNHD